MSPVKSAIVETISKGRLRGLPSRKVAPADRLEKIKNMASALLQEAESLAHGNALAEASAAVENLKEKPGTCRAHFRIGHYYSQLQDQVLRNALAGPAILF